MLDSILWVLDLVQVLLSPAAEACRGVEVVLGVDKTLTSMTSPRQVL